MKLPELKNAPAYKGLYVIDFGDSCSVGFTDDEVCELLESERYSDIKVYKVCNAYTDGTIELKGVANELFQLEAGLFFYADNSDQTGVDYQNLINLAIRTAPPARAKVHLSKINQNTFVTALIYPANTDDLFSQWLLDGDYQTAGSVQGGINCVNDYYNNKDIEILKRHQLFAADTYESKTGNELLMATRVAVQR